MTDDVTAREATLATGDDELDRMKLALETVIGVPFTGGNAIEILENGDEIFPAMLDAIRSAEHQIEFLTYVYWSGNVAQEFVDALSERARNGVRVLAVLDGHGARPMPQELIDRLEDSGVELRWFRPLPRWKVWQTDNRTHRKILVIDGKTGFTGGVGIAQEWEGNAERPEDWRDTHFRVQGPAVLGLRGAFYEDWMESSLSVEAALHHMESPGLPGDLDVQVIPSTASIGRSDIAALHDCLIRMAQHRLRIASAYVSPTDETVDLLVAAAERGVEIDVLMPGPHADMRLSELSGSNAFEPLLKAGAKLWKYQPTMYHTKLITVDGILSVLGSANFNHRSVIKDDEVAMNVLNRDFTAAIDDQIDRDIEQSKALELGEWQDRGLWCRIKEWLVSRITFET